MIRFVKQSTKRTNLLILIGNSELLFFCRWFNDLYLFNFADLKWKKIEYPVHQFAPVARSGFQLASHVLQDTIFLFGGYSKVKVVRYSGQLDFGFEIL